MSAAETSDWPSVSGPLENEPSVEVPASTDDRDSRSSSSATAPAHSSFASAEALRERLGFVNKDATPAETPTTELFEPPAEPVDNVISIDGEPLRQDPQPVPAEPDETPLGAEVSDDQPLSGGLSESVLGDSFLGESVLGESVPSVLGDSESVLDDSVLGGNVLSESALGESVPSVLGDSETVLGESVLGESVLGESVLGDNSLDGLLGDDFGTTLEAPETSAPIQPPVEVPEFRNSEDIFGLDSSLSDDVEMPELSAPGVLEPAVSSGEDPWAYMRPSDDEDVQSGGFLSRFRGSSKPKQKQKPKKAEVATTRALPEGVASPICPNCGSGGQVDLHDPVARRLHSSCTSCAHVWTASYDEAPS